MSFWGFPKNLIFFCSKFGLGHGGHDIKFARNAGYENRPRGCGSVSPIKMWHVHQDVLDAFLLMTLKKARFPLGVEPPKKIGAPKNDIQSCSVMLLG